MTRGQLAQPGGATQPAAGDTSPAADLARAANARSDFNIGYCGYRFNGDIGAYTVRFRHYDPTPGMCRWLERDPAGYQDGPSLYSYLGRNPMAGTDPYGQFLNLGTALGGAVVGGIVGGVAAAINGEDWLEGAAKGAVVGGIAGATLGVGLAIAGTTTTATVVGSGIASGITGAAANAVVYEGRAPTLEELNWGGLFGGATAGTFHVAYGVGRAGLGAIWGKRTAQPGSVPRPGPGGALPEGFTLPVPEGIPSSWRIAPSNSGGGVKFTDPLNAGNEVRVMPGRPTAKWPNSRKPYVRWDKDGVPLDADGNPLPTRKCEPAHIPLEDFRFDPSIFKR